ncbi:hypothetical protein GCM10009795_048720 [Nocardioides hankookensis]|uniref:Uncharacterized protein n=1 Tax=Nocardioides hankookensis TaxID=443157 RepID=A0ABW1LG92_9ACTN
MSTARARWAAAAVGLLLVAPLNACSDDDGMCANANDYVWYTNYFAGAYDGPPPADEIDGVIDTVVGLAGDLRDQVPSETRAQADTAYETWTTTRDVFADADLSTDEGADAAIDELVDAVGDNQQSNEDYVDWLRDECGDDDSDWPSKPDSAD